ncbi:trigger factor [Tenuifilum thalassicum]|uniref:Trigger factor n=1 Tax=Tenuifilum thalassicum TaxID=2590900 RepID=A0A7D3XJC8_9BACT|nr:trigger factor [Tenuifilum thalassicum]QKG78750.1 trigger factor [Tenuifilum thalassicum]
MNIVREDIDSLTATIKVQVEKDDYAANVEKSLIDYRKKANINGFRPGKAPMSLIKKMYYRYVLADEVTKIAFDKLYEYIKENNIRTLGEPIPSEKQPAFDWEKQENFEFSWDIGLAPEIDINVNKRTKFTLYKIKPTEELRKNYIETYRSRQGKYVDVEQTDEKGLVKATLTELNEDESPREGGVTVEGASISVALVADKDEQKKLIGVKVGDVLTIDTQKAFPNEADRAALLHVKKEELGDINPLFQLTVTETLTFALAELNQEFFNAVYGEGIVNSEEEFYQKIDEEIEHNLAQESEYRFGIDLKEKLLEKLNIELPKDFLIRWLTNINEGKFTREQIESEYPMFEKDLKWQLISNKVAEEQNFTVTNEELEQFAMVYARNQFAAYGMNFLPDEYIQRYAADILKNRDEVRKIQERIIDKKVIDWFRENVGISEKEITMDEFQKLK